MEEIQGSRGDEGEWFIRSSWDPAVRTNWRGEKNTADLRGHNLNENVLSVSCLSISHSVLTQLLILTIHTCACILYRKVYTIVELFKNTVKLYNSYKAVTSVFLNTTISIFNGTHTLETP